MKDEATARLLASHCRSREFSSRTAALPLIWMGALGLAIYAVAAALILATYFEERASMWHRAERMAHAAVYAIDLKVAAARSLLFGLATATPLAENSISALRETAAEAASSQQRCDILLFDSQGDLLWSTGDRPQALLHVAAEMARTAAAAAGSDPQVALAETAFGSALVVTIPVTREGGSRYALALALPADDLLDALKQTPQGGGWITMLLDGVGSRPALFSMPADMRPGTRDDLLRHIRGADREGTFLASEAQNMMVGYSRSQETNWIALVGVPGAVAAAPARRARLALIGGGALALLFAAVAAQIARRRMAQRHARDLGAREARLATMADIVPAILFTAGRGAGLHYVNQRFYDFTKRPSGAAMGLGWLDSLHPDDREHARESFAADVREDGILLLELRLCDGEGCYRWFLVRLRRLCGPESEDFEWFGSATDIDHIKRSEAALRAANARLAAVLAGIDECYFMVDSTSRVTAVNDAAATWLGREPGGLIGRELPEVAPDLTDSGLAALRKAVGKRKPFHLEERSVRTPGRWLEVRGYPWADGHSIFFRDITRRKSAEETTRRTRRLLEGTLNALTACVVVLDKDGIIVAGNQAWRRFRGTNCRIGARYIDACRTMTDLSDSVAIARGLKAVLEGKESEFRMHYLSRSQPPAWLQMRARRFDGEPRYVVVAHEDVTEITQAKMDIEALAGKMLAVQDEERRRIARELHDTTTQNLVVALMIFDAVSDAVIANDEARAQQLREVRSAIEMSIRDLRTLSYVLHPPLLEERGLASALKWLIHGFERRSGIGIHFACCEDFPRPAPEIERALFRVVQEALTNVHRHSGSATARVRLSQGAGDVILEVSDQGKGITDRQTIAAADLGSLGVGISGMRARLRQLGGTLEIRSTRTGTTVLARVPIGTADRSLCIVGQGVPATVRSDQYGRAVSLQTKEC